MKAEIIYTFEGKDPVKSLPYASKTMLIFDLQRAMVELAEKFFAGDVAKIERIEIREVKE